MHATRIAPANRLKQKLGESSPADDFRAIAVLEQEFEGFSGQFAPVMAQWMSDMKRCLEQPGSGTIDCLYSRAHELRGMAGSFGHVELGRLADSLCRYLSSAASPEDVDTRLLQAHINAMQLMHRERLTDSTACQTMVAALEYAMQKASRRK